MYGITLILASAMKNAGATDEEIKHSLEQRATEMEMRIELSERVKKDKLEAHYLLAS